MHDRSRFARSVSTTVAVIGVCCSVIGCSSNSDTSPRSSATGSSTSAPKAAPLKATSVGEDMVQPRRIEASGGTLATNITVAQDAFEVGGVAVEGKGYAGAFIGPTLALRPGDTLRIELQNRLTEATNLHFHGLHVSPDEPSDDVLMHIDPRSTFSYEVKIPATHPSGTFWYHSHQHGSSEEQVFGGLSGLIVVNGQSADLAPALGEPTEAEFVLKDTQVTGDSIQTTNIDSGAPTTRTVNGQVNPVYRLAPGETQLWRFANVGADIFYELHLVGQQFHVIAEDGNPAWAVWPADRLVLPPGKRFDVLVVGPPPGTYRLITAPYDQGGDQYPEVQLATVRSEGTPRPVGTLPTSMAERSDLATATVGQRRRLVFSEEDTQSKFMIDGRQFDANRVDQHVRLGAVEEWTIENATKEQHPFHIHVNDFQVMSIGGEPYDARSLQDTVNLPPGKDVVIRTRFADFTGKFVYHCHILNHEDNGMMGIVDVSR